MNICSSTSVFMKKFWILLLFFAGTLGLCVYYSYQDMNNYILQHIENIDVTTVKLHNKTNKLMTEKVDTEPDFAYHKTTTKYSDLQVSNSTQQTHYLERTTLSGTNHYNTENNGFSNIINLASIKQSDNNIFFIETTCRTEDLLKSYNLSAGIHLSPRQCCSVESAAVTNKNHNIYILYTCPLNMKVYEQSPDYIKETLAHSNVYLVSFTLKEIFQGSPVDNLYHSNKINSSLYPTEHLSDVLRFLTLWKYGGTYIDLDTITIRCLDKLKYNYAGLESSNSMGSAVLNFKFDGIGHDILTYLLKELNVSFNGAAWTANGPDLVTRIILQQCNFDKMEQLTTKNCSAFTIYTTKYFYPVYYNLHNIFFGEMSSDELSKRFNESYVIHFWNRLSKNTTVKVGSNQVYGVLADKFCSSVYHNCGSYF